MLAIIAVFVLIGLDKIYVTVTDVLKETGGSSDIFTTQTSIALFSTMTLMFLERYINRANVMKVDEQPQKAIK